MVKTFRLECRGSGVYEYEGKVVLCGEVIRMGLGMELENKYDGEGNLRGMPSAVEVKVSNEPIEDEEGIIKVGVVKGGYYRWSFRYLEEYHRFFSTSRGLYFDVEKVLDDFFPDARVDGLDKEKCLWIKIREMAI